MNLDLRPYIAVWALFALSVLVLFLRRKMVASKEDDQLHVMSGANPDQVIVAHKLEAIDKWGKILTAITVLFGLVIAFLYVYSNFVGRNSLGE